MANNAVTAKARAVHGSFLTKEDYLNLIHRPTIASVVAYLKTKPLYAQVFADTDEAQIHRAQAEELINRSVFDNYIRICRFSSGGKKGIMGFLIKQLESEQLVKAVIAVSSGSQVGFLTSFPGYITEYMSFDPMKLAKAKDLSETAEAIRGTMYYKPLVQLLTSPAPDVNRIITTINVCYIKWVFAQIDACEKGKTRERLKEFFLRKADADNLLMCRRLKSTFGLDAAQISELMIPYHRRLRQSAIETALRSSDPVAALNDLFVKTRVAAAGVSDIPEINVNIADWQYFRHRLAVSSNETESLYALMMLFRAESTDLCRIIEGIRYGLAPEEIEKYLIVR